MKSTEQIRFDKPAAEWLEALPSGNGRLGAMVMGDTHRETIYLNEDTCVSNGYLERTNTLSARHLDEIRSWLLDEEVEKVQKYTPRYFYSSIPTQPHYEPLAQCWLEMGTGEVAEYHRTLDLSEAVLSVDYLDDGCAVHREAFTSYPDDVFVYRFESPDKPLDMSLYVTRRNGMHMRSSSFADRIHPVGDAVVMEAHNGDADGGLDASMAVTVRTDGSWGIYGTRVCIDGASTVTIYVAGRTTYRTADPTRWCAERLDAATAMAYEDLRRRHVADYQALYGTFSLELGDPTSFADSYARRMRGDITPPFVETFVNYGRYLLISSSREGSVAANMQGIWSYDFDPLWGARYTINCNTQMNYWISENTGLPSTHMALMDLVRTMYPHAQDTARMMYGMGGAVAHHNTDIWGDCAPADYYAPSTIWPFGYVWLMLHAIDHYRYTHDTAFLVEFLPIIQDNVRFLLQYLFVDEGGTYQTGPSVSPENTFRTPCGQLGTITMSCEMDIALVREFLGGYLQICEEGGIAELCDEARHILDHLPHTQVTSYGTIMEYHKEYAETELGHRHISQLFGLYPGTTINGRDTAELMEPAYRTIRRRLEHGGGGGGWSAAWIACWLARLGKATDAEDMIRRTLVDYTAPNLFGIATDIYAFQIDTNMGLPGAVLECLVRDYGDRVELLPAVAGLLQQGHMQGFCLRCGALVDMAWRGGRLASLRMKALRDVSVVVSFANEQMDVRLSAGEELVRDYEL